MNEFNNKHQNQFETNMSDIVHIIFRHKYALIIAVCTLLIMTFLFNEISVPKYKATVTLKKEILYNDRQADAFNEMILFRTMDEIDNEIEIIKTRTIFEKVIRKFNLCFVVKDIKLSDGEKIRFSCNLIIYDDYIKSKRKYYDRFPIIEDIRDTAHTVSKNYYVKISEMNELQLFDEENNQIIISSSSEDKLKINIQMVHLNLGWLNGRTGDKFSFQISSFEDVYDALQKNTTIEKLGKTNIFKLNFYSSSPKMAQLIANSIAEKYRETRLEQKKQTIQYSFDFVDHQLQDISVKLDSTEKQLSQFKSRSKITNLDENSSQIIESLSNLELEKIKTDLELAEYQNRLSGMQQEIDRKRYFDQTYLSPNKITESRTPFAALLEQLTDLEIKRLELMQRRKANHPDVITLNEQIAQIKDRLSEYNQNTITSYQIIINSLLKKSENLNSLILQYSSRIENLPVQESKLINLVRKKNVFDKMFTLLLDKREELRMAELSKIQDIITIDSATMPYKPISPKKLLNLILALFAGILIGLVDIFIQEAFSKKITKIEDIERSQMFPILGVIPKYDKKLFSTINNSKSIGDRFVVLMNTEHIAREAYSLIKAKLINSNTEKIGKIFLITSCEENSGKTTIVSNLGLSLARSKKRVLIIDSDLRKAALSKIFNTPTEFPGINDFIHSNIEFPKLYKPFSDDSNALNLQILPAGEFIENGSDSLESKKFIKMLHDVSHRFDFILLDAPPVTVVVDTLVLGKMVKNVILVVRPNITYKDSLSFAKDEMNSFGIKIQGVIINGYEKTMSTSKYKYGYGYGYGYAQKK